ncbi:hypothetical protein TgHK011_004317 [Trichoderma gracile]|nr:hypothetical protein TgHK011_004317 [Trichoderma gracile]
MKPNRVEFGSWLIRRIIGQWLSLLRFRYGVTCKVSATVLPKYTSPDDSATHACWTAYWAIIFRHYYLMGWPAASDSSCSEDFILTHRFFVCHAGFKPPVKRQNRGNDAQFPLRHSFRITEHLPDTICTIALDFKAAAS